MDKYERHRQIEREQSRQQLKNCALLLAYVHGLPGGWYGIASGHIDGFRSDYALIHSHPGNLELHPIRAFYLDGAEDCLDELEDIRRAVKDYHHLDELPPVTTLTAEEKTAALQAVREAFEESGQPDAADWLRKLCADAPASDLSFCDWDAVAAVLTGKAD